VFGGRWPSPLYLSAVSGMRAFHPEGELAVGRAAKTRAMQMMLSSGSSTPLAEVSRAVGAAPWQQCASAEALPARAAQRYRM
jgi:isopentenyl diphosphate isomerase/L-lactate dehydrogenase-like FMN-dependent dehydrogenase